MIRFCTILLFLSLLTSAFAQPNVVLVSKRGAHQLLWVKDGAISKSLDVGQVSLYGQADNRLFTVGRSKSKDQASDLTIWNLDTAKQEASAPVNILCAAFPGNATNQIAYFPNKQFLFFVGLNIKREIPTWHMIRYDIPNKAVSFFSLPKMSELPRISATSGGLLLFLPKSDKFKLMNIQNGQLADMKVGPGMNSLYPSREMVYFDDLGLMTQPKLKGWKHFFAGDTITKTALKDFGIASTVDIIAFSSFKISDGSAIAIGAKTVSDQFPVAVVFDVMGLRAPQLYTLPATGKSYCPGPDNRAIFFVDRESGMLISYDLTSKSSKTLTKQPLPQKNLVAVVR